MEVSVVEDDMSFELRRFWDYESLGIVDKGSLLYDEFVSEVKLIDGRYQVRLPFKENHDLLPDNFSLSKSRLVSLLKRLRPSPELLERYNDVIQEQMKQGIIEPVEQGIHNGVGRVHYIPHHKVVRIDKQTTKLRVVYDASARAGRNTPSLNDCLYAGPPLSPLIYDILLRFRVYKTAITGDIEKAFLNILVDPRDRDYLRFLWVDDIKDQHSNLQAYRFTRVAFGVSASPFLLNATVRHHLTSTERTSEFAQRVLKSLYVDDYVGGDDSDQSAFEVYKNLKSFFKGGGSTCESGCPILQSCKRELKNLKANFYRHHQSLTGLSRSLHSVFGSEEIHDATKHKVLGIVWDSQKDMWFLDLASPLETVSDDSVTKRAILGATSKLYDPLGLLSPVIILLKIIFQSICKSKVGWDDPVDSFLYKQWLKLVQDTRKVGVVELKRHYFRGSSSVDLLEVQLHGFADASDKAYGAVVYLRIKLTSGMIYTPLLSSKTRVAPINGETTPRLELLGALILARLVRSVVSAFEGTLRIDYIYCWLDSQIALWWIWGVNKEFKQFVQNRVVEIRSLVKPTKWDYCPTESNPADICSRGLLASKLITNQLWWNAPEFLLRDKQFWPSLRGKSMEVTKDNSDPCLELKKEGVNSYTKEQNSSVLANIVSERTIAGKLNLQCIISLERFSSLHRLIRVTAYVLRFITNVKQSKEGKELTGGDLKQEEVNQARELWYKMVQTSVLEDKQFDQVKISLALYTDEKGILRCGGRLKNAPIRRDARFPIFLPKSSHFTHLAINDCHLKVLHSGVKDTLTQLRSKFWVPKGRQAVRDAIRKCPRCKRIEGRSYSVPPTPPLPEFRLSDEFAFTRVGVDFAGPVYVKDVYSKKVEMNKAYIALFTCATTRAVHLELVPNLRAESFTRALIRFKGRRGTPALIVSDNGKTFKDSRVMTVSLISIKFVY